MEPPIPDALSKSTLGNRTLVLTAWLHFALGNRLSQIIKVFNFHLQMRLTSGGLVQMWHRLASRLEQLIDTAWEESHAKRLVKRLRRHQDHVFTFLDQPGVPFENNLDEREIRAAVSMRKNSYGNRSDQGADTQAILMSIFRTLRKRGHHPIQTITNALAVYIQTRQLPPLPAPTTADG